MSAAHQLKDIHRAILEVLARARTPISAYDLLAKINQKKGAKPYAPPQVYRALKSLTEKRLAHRLEIRNAYVACRHTSDHQDDCTHNEAAKFLVCSQCGETVEIEIPFALKAMNQAAAKVGFTITQPVIELVGLCASCRAAQQQDTRRKR